MTKKIYNDLIKEELYYEKLENGLEIFYMPKKGFTKQYAVFATNYGSNDLEFVPIGKDKKIRVNEGIAHFLEHKMFEQDEDVNAFDEFARLGVSANAYTNFTMTSYLFSSTENFHDALAHLVDYVQTPYFTDENVEKEKGIIAQEIKMYDDNPDWKVYFNTLKAMYKEHPINIDIAGTVESIYKISKEELYDCYNTFYNPANMALFVVGDLDFEEIKATILKSLKEKPHMEDVKRFYPVEPKEINKKEIVEKMHVSMPSFNIGFKDNDVNISGAALLKKEIEIDMLIQMLFKKGSEFYMDMYNEGIINDTFGGDFTGRVDHGYTVIGGEANDPHLVREKIFECIERYKAEGLSKEQFERIKKKEIGNYLRYFDSLEFIANNFISYHFRGINLLDYVDILKSISFEDIEKRFVDHFKEEFSVISIVEPK